MVNSPLPVRLGPRPGEPLTSYAARLADANGVLASSILNRQRRDVGVPANEIRTVAALGGISEDDAVLLTMDRYPPSVRGSGPTHRGGWRLHYSVSWACPGCTAITGRIQLLWQSALMPVCRDCGLLLVWRRGAHGSIPASPEVLDIVTRLVDLAEDAVTRHAARVRLGRFRRLVASIAQTIDDNWPARPDHCPAVDRDAARQWGAFPCPDPMTVATLLAAAAPALHASREYEGLAREAPLRRQGQPQGAPREVPAEAATGTVTRAADPGRLHCHRRRTTALARRATDPPDAPIRAGAAARARHAPLSRRGRPAAGPGPVAHQAPGSDRAAPCSVNRSRRTGLDVAYMHHVR